MKISNSFFGPEQQYVKKNLEIQKFDQENQLKTIIS